MTRSNVNERGFLPSGSEVWKPTSIATRFLVLLRKELLELLRSYKLIWVPLVFIILGIMQPVTNYYMPVILEKAGNMPVGTIIEIPKMSGVQVLTGTLSQFGTIGSLILVLAFMGIVSGERNSGAASMILVKPITFGAYITSKWTSMLIMSWGSLFAGYSASWYYTWQLFEWVDVKPFMTSYVLYSLWFSFVLTIALLFSSMLRSAAGAAFTTLGISILLSLLAGLLPKFLGSSPGALSGYAYEAVSGSISNSSGLGWTIGITLVFIILSLMCSVTLLRRTPALD
ncbi:ABC transporter permease [Paenibacillus sp. GSMTC-2017]|uniref:ABC transporter permease n=1 Tax=Paenibacillus sp. GSMTC-2017 TaxID=2794350 RepID=UPI0018D80DE6|nr:ABC transporter permease subunit [Paenibacillus sp. GSMTC-2017]MBH5320164.1 ABC transporter permease [Paenibacillus sp. GSMTC-2017]